MLHSLKLASDAGILYQVFSIFQSCKLIFKFAIKFLHVVSLYDCQPTTFQNYHEDFALESVQKKFFLIHLKLSKST